jgi:hypothetical protein
MSNLISFLHPSDNKTGYDKAKESYFTFNNPSVGTGIALNADPTAIAATEAALIVDNSANRSNGDNHHVIIDYIKMTCTAAGTGATKARLAFYIDNINRYSSGGTELTGKSTSYDTTSNYSDRTPKAKVYFGDLTAAAASSAKHLHTSLIKSDTQAAPCFIVDDSFFLSHFVEPSFQQDAASSPVVSAKFKIPYIPLGPGTSLVVAPLFPNQSAAASFEIEVGLVEKGHPTTT